MAVRLFFSLIAILAFGAIAKSDVAVDPNALANPVLEDRARALMKKIRCLVCQNQSIEDSNAVIAKTIRDRVRAEISAGKSDAEINASLVEDYGDWVMLSPPVDTRTVLLWGSPFLLLGGAILIIITRRRKSSGLSVGPVEALSAAEERTLNDMLDEPSLSQKAGPKVEKQDRTP